MERAISDKRMPDQNREARRTAVLLQDVTKTQLQLLKTDLELAGTFVRRTRTSRFEETRQRNRALARRAYDDISEMASKMKLPQSEKASVVAALETLKHDLEALGETF